MLFVNFIKVYKNKSNRFRWKHCIQCNHGQDILARECNQQCTTILYNNCTPYDSRQPWPPCEYASCDSCHNCHHVTSILVYAHTLLLSTYYLKYYPTLHAQYCTMHIIHLYLMAYGSQWNGLKCEIYVKHRVSSRMLEMVGISHKAIRQYR